VQGSSGLCRSAGIAAHTRIGRVAGCPDSEKDSFCEELRCQRAGQQTGHRVHDQRCGKFAAGTNTGNRRGAYAQLRPDYVCAGMREMDERVAAHLATEEISIGDFVLSGGELPAALIVDAVARLLARRARGQRSLFAE